MCARAYVDACVRLSVCARVCEGVGVEVTTVKVENFVVVVVEIVECENEKNV